MEPSTTERIPPTSEGYLLGHTDSENRRLMIQAQLYDPYTEMFFRKAGVKDGMSVLDIGSGMGDVAFLAAKLVGPTGQVTGIDSDADVVRQAGQRAKALGLANVKFVTGDVSAFAFDDQLDAIVGRLVLCHLKDPVALLEQLVTYLRPGGLLVFEDNAALRGARWAVPACVHVERAFDLILKVFDEVGVDAGFGYKFPRMFAKAGLAPPALEYFVPTGAGPDWLGYKWLAEGIRTLLPSILRLGFATEVEVDIDTLEARMRKEAVDRQSVVMLGPHIVAWARLA